MPLVGAPIQLYLWSHGEKSKTTETQYLVLAKPGVKRINMEDRTYKRRSEFIICIIIQNLGPIFCLKAKPTYNRPSHVHKVWLHNMCIFDVTYTVHDGLRDQQLYVTCSIYLRIIQPPASPMSFHQWRSSHLHDKYFACVHGWYMVIVIPHTTRSVVNMLCKERSSFDIGIRSFFNGFDFAHCHLWV